MCARISVRTRKPICTQTRVQTNTQTQTHARARAHAHAHAHTYAHAHAHAHTRTHTHTHTTRTRTRVNTYAHTHTHTSTHEHTLVNTHTFARITSTLEWTVRGTYVAFYLCVCVGWFVHVHVHECPILDCVYVYMQRNTPHPKRLQKSPRVCSFLPSVFMEKKLTFSWRLLQPRLPRGEHIFEQRFLACLSLSN